MTVCIYIYIYIYQVHRFFSSTDVASHVGTTISLRAHNRQRRCLLRSHADCALCNLREHARAAKLQRVVAWQCNETWTQERQNNDMKWDN